MAGGRWDAGRLCPRACLWVGSPMRCACPCGVQRCREAGRRAGRREDVQAANPQHGPSSASAPAPALCRPHAPWSCPRCKAATAATACTAGRTGPAGGTQRRLALRCGRCRGWRGRRQRGARRKASKTRIGHSVGACSARSPGAGGVGAGAQRSQMRRAQTGRLQHTAKQQLLPPARSGRQAPETPTGDGQVLQVAAKLARCMQLRSARNPLAHRSSCRGCVLGRACTQQGGGWRPAPPRAAKYARLSMQLQAARSSPYPQLENHQLLCPCIAAMGW